MRAKIIYSLLLTIALNTFGCGAKSADLFSFGPARMESMALSDGISAQKMESQFNEALALLADLRYSQAMEKLLPLIQAFEAVGNRDRTAEATFWLGYCYEKQGQKDEAVDFYDRVVRTYPQSPAARQATERLSHLINRTAH